MRLTRIAALAASCGLASSSLAPSGRSIFKRSDYDVCNADRKLEGQACPPTSAGSWAAPLFPFAGFTTKSAKVTWKLKGNFLAPARLDDPASQYRTYLWAKPKHCGPASLQAPFPGELEPVGGGAVVSFNQAYPCTNYMDTPEGNTCTAWDTSYTYIEGTYRCSKCEPNHPTPSKQCEVGTAFGYQEPVQGVQKSFDLSTQPGKGCCPQWGWFDTPTLAEPQSGINGPLLVEAGRDKWSKPAIRVGIWTASANATGMTVLYKMNPPYTLTESFIDLVRIPIDNCIHYSLKVLAIPPSTIYTSSTLKYSTCGERSRAALVVKDRSASGQQMGKDFDRDSVFDYVRGGVEKGLRDSTCTSCTFSGDFSSCWTAAMHHHDAQRLLQARAAVSQLTASAPTAANYRVLHPALRRQVDRHGLYANLQREELIG
ncbi:hypothetical protein B0H63DRAFT_543811 [Podospora didyma]|uniref:Uncharacterized protein n=1 Tax=Podospora didyma TaxID=330526 RepID=A0AAE0NPR8_9PEZI|nr:hypothetical protein B0H63DRAFT_543811 [Podospora didyma]